MKWDLPQPEDLILVGIIPTPHDLEIAKVLGWYRIPLRFAPKMVRVDYLAFYQPGTFGDKHKWKIESISRILGVELVYRRDLIREEPDHPRAKEEYYKMQIGDLIPLPRPVYSKDWKRITFFYTTGRLIMKASIVNDLIVKDEERDILLRSIRERATQSDMYSSNKLPEFILNEDILKFLGIFALTAEEINDYQSY